MIREIAAKFNEICMGKFKIVILDEDGKIVTDLKYLLKEGTDLDIEHALTSAVKMTVESSNRKNLLGVSSDKGADATRNTTMWETNHTEKLQ